MTRCVTCSKFLPEGTYICTECRQRRDQNKESRQTMISQETAVKITSMASTKTAKQISDEINLPVKVVKNFCKTARITTLPESMVMISVNITLNTDTVSKLKFFAKRRNEPFKDLIKKLLDTIARDEMVDAIFDDDGSFEEKPKAVSSHSTAPREDERPGVVSHQIRNHLASDDSEGGVPRPSRSDE